MNEIEKLDNWNKLCVLGSGGFGVVTLWKNSVTGKMVALKMCREGSESFISSRNKERWCKEVEIMRKLLHPNIVKAENIPEEFKQIKTEFPMLCMEYCIKGDLRKILNLAENSCGLQEADVRNILRDVKSAIEYLHEEKIIHRDLKPENIVMQENSNSEIIYKLIDLGYAKELNQSSLCSSFVGTLQYVAPEIFSQVYTCSVDYWSFGLVCHEIITGFRPFLPHMNPVSWMNHVKLKSSEDICIYQNSDGVIEYSQELFPENHITQCLKYACEKWLRLALEWDGSKRGRSADDQLIIFSSLESYLNKKILTIFSVVGYEKLSYEVDSSTAITTLQLWVERDTKQIIADQLLLIPSGEAVGLEAFAYKFWDNSQDIMIYIFSKSGFKLPEVPPKLPTLVVKMLEAPKVSQPYFYIKRSWPNCIFFVHSQLLLFQFFLEAYAVKMLSIMQQVMILTNLENSIASEMEQIIAKQNLNSDSLDYDKKCFNRLQLNLSGDFEKQWEERHDTCNRRVQQLNELSKKMRSKVSFVGKTLSLLESHQETEQSHIEKLRALLETSYRVYNSFRRKPKEVRDKVNSIDMVKIVYNCLKERDRMLRDEQFSAHLQEVSNYEREISHLQAPLHTLKQHINRCNSDITRCQLLRQKDIWQIIMNMKTTSPNADNSVMKSEENASLSSGTNP